MLSGSILDAYPDFEKNVMVTWLWHDGKTTRIEEPYHPCFYVHTPSKDISVLAKTLEMLPQVSRLHITPAKIVLGSPKHAMVLQVVPKNMNSLHPLASLVDSWGKFHDYQLFNVDLRLPTRYLQERNVFCHAWVHWDGKQFILDDEQWALDYDIPVLKILHLSIKQKKGLTPSLHDPITTMVLDDERIEEGNETDTILSVVQRIHEIDPDVIATVNGDSILFPLLAHRAKICGIEHLVNLGRDKKQKKNTLRPVKKSKSYFSYGRIVYRPAFYTLMGRIHLDTAQSFFYGESGLRGILDIARCANIPLQLLSRLGPGTAISQMEVNTAMVQGYLIPWKKNMPENWKTAEELLVADRGGLMLEPVVGLHEDVVELDYASLYPNVMLLHNISPETILCSCCPDSTHRVPQLGYHICERQKGLLPQVLEPILLRRFCFKARAKNKNYDKELYRELQKAWKWVLVVCFGYTGYRNARYGRIECHESITAYSRDILLNAVAVAEQGGYEVLHGIIDSLWVKGRPGCVRSSQLSRMIGNRTGIRMDVEGRYHWIVFLPSKGTGAGALTRYYGMFENKELKVRGIELRQHNTPEFLRTVQQEILHVFTAAENSKQFRELLPASLKVVQEYAQMLLDGKVDGNDLMFTTTISKDVLSYKVNNLVKSALLQLRDLDIQSDLGQSVRYMVTDEHSRDYKHRVCVAERSQGNETIDVNFYLRQIAKCAESILTPFGYTIEILEEMLKKTS